MNVFRKQTRAMRATLLVALITSASAVASAQKPVGPPVLKPIGPPVGTKGTVQSSPKADKGQATAEAARAAARERKETQAAFKAARRESKALNKGIKFTRDEKRAYGAIAKRHRDGLKALEKSDYAAHKVGETDPMIRARLHAMRMSERSELRSLLTPVQRIRFDFNVAALDGTK